MLRINKNRVPDLRCETCGAFVRSRYYIQDGDTPRFEFRHTCVYFPSVEDLDALKYSEKDSAK